MEEHLLNQDDIIDDRTCVWIENEQLLISIFTDDNKNHVFEIDLFSGRYTSYIEEL